VNDEDQLDRFGRFLVESLRDPALELAEGLLEQRWKAPALATLQKQLALLTEDQRQLVFECVRRSVDNGIHDFLFALQERTDEGDGVTVTTGGVEVSSMSDGLHGEPLGDGGWYARFSRFS
jgi:hypothetical protein